MSTNFITAPRPCLGLFIFQSPRARTAPKALLLDNPIFCSYLCPKVMLLILPFVRGFQEQALCRHNWDFFLGTSANVCTLYQHISRAGSVKGEFI